MRRAFTPTMERNRDVDLHTGATIPAREAT